MLNLTYGPHPDVDAEAARALELMPEAHRAYLVSETGPRKIVTPSGDANQSGRAFVNDVINNNWLVQTMVESRPMMVASVFDCAMFLIAVDNRLEGLGYKSGCGTEEQSRRALHDAGWLKKMLQCSRKLWRNTPSASKLNPALESIRVLYTARPLFAAAGAIDDAAAAAGGEDGADGADGADGTDGEDDADGADGVMVQDGDGADDADGMDGLPLGADGADGDDGMVEDGDCPDGSDGPNFADWGDGADGGDGCHGWLKCRRRLLEACWVRPRSGMDGLTHRADGCDGAERDDGADGDDGGDGADGMDADGADGSGDFRNGLSEAYGQWLCYMAFDREDGDGADDADDADGYAAWCRDHAAQVSREDADGADDGDGADDADESLAMAAIDDMCPLADVLDPDLASCPSADGDDGADDCEEAASSLQLVASYAPGSGSERPPWKRQRRITSKSTRPNVAPPDFLVPSSDALSASMPIATPGAQHNIVEKKSKKASDAAGLLASVPIVDESRVLPENFDENCDVAYARIPEAALPQGPCRGTANYTIKDASLPQELNVIEIQLLSKTFYIKKMKGKKWDRVADGSPLFSWMPDGPAMAWEAVTGKVSWKSA